MTTSWPRSVSSRTPEGVRATRYSSVLISVGTPTFIRGPSSSGSIQQFAASQGQPEVDPVARGVQRAAGELLDAADPIAQRVPVAEQLLRCPFPLAVALDEDLQRAHQFTAV